MNGWDVLKYGSLAVGGLAGLGFAGRAMYRASLNVYDAVYERWRRRQHDKLTIERIADQNELQNIRQIFADEKGRYPLLYGKGGILRDPNTLRAFTLQTVLERWPHLEQLDWMHKMLSSAERLSASTARQIPELAEGADDPSPWPERITLQQALRGQRPSIERLIVGAYPTDQGLGVVSESIHNLMHVLEVGASGWGKSAWLRAFLWQIARAPEACDVVAIDVSGSEFNVLNGWGKLRYPVARTTDEAIAVLHQVSEEITRRRQWYEQHPLVTNLPEYNQATGADLPPLVCVIDEGTHLLNQKGIGDVLRDAVQTARQYGIYVLLAGQSAKHSVIDTQIRDQFSTRLCFRVSPTSSRVVLEQSVASDLHTKGRAWVQLVGRVLQEVQGPWVERSELVNALGNGGPREPMPDLQPPEAGPNENEIAQVLELHAGGESLRAIERAVFGYEGGAAHRQVKEILDAYAGATTATATTGDRE